MSTANLIRGIIPALLLSAAAFASNALLADAAQNDDQQAVAALLRQKADVNAAQGDGMTALHWAVVNGDAALVKTLLAAGANVKAATRDEGLTPLFLASSAGRAGIAEELLKAGADPESADALGTTALMAAARSGSVDTVKALLNHGAKINATESHGQTALIFAASQNRADAITFLVAHGADTRIATQVTKLERPRFDEDGNSLPERPAARAGARPQSPAAAAAAARRASATKIGGLTALILAARDDQRDAVRALLDAGADVNEAGAGDKTTPLVMAIINGHYDLAKYLLDRGANPNLANEDGLTPLYAVEDTQYAPIGWSPNPIVAQEKIGYLDLMKALLERGTDPNARLEKKLWFRPTNHDQMWIGSAGTTTFWRAAQATDLAAMRLLVAHGADPKIPSNEGVNALMVASGLGWAGNFSINAPDSPLEVVKYCLELGLDPTPRDVQGFTALAGAAYRGQNELVKLLVQKGANLDARTSRGWSVTDMAMGPSLRTSVPVQHPDTVALLISLGAPPLTAVEGEEILGVIKGRAPALREKEADDPGKPAIPDKQQGTQQ